MDKPTPIWKNKVEEVNLQADTQTYGVNGTTGGSHNHTFTGTSINLAVYYIDMIIASKN